MKYSKLNSVYAEWIRSVEAKETDRTFCAVDEYMWDEGTDYYLVGFGMDKNRSEEFITKYGRFHDYGPKVITEIYDLSKRNDKKLYDCKFKDGKVIFGSWDKLRRFHF